MKYTALLIFVFISIGHQAKAHDLPCLTPGKTAGPYDEWGFPVDTSTSGNSVLQTANDELDLIYSLLTYAIVFKTWQTDIGITTPMRGHNYGAVLVGPNNEIAHWGRNEVFAHKDGTQHGETRAIQQFLSKTGESDLKGYTIYVGGDSCPMCAGMISQQGIVRAVLGLSHPLFGKNFDRMNLDSRNCGKDDATGLAPVTRMVAPVMSPSGIRKELDQTFRQVVIKSCGGSKLEGCKKFPSQTDFLKSKLAFDIFEKANKQFLEYEVKFPKEKAKNSQKTNSQIYQDAVLFLKNKVN